MSRPRKRIDEKALLALQKSGASMDELAACFDVSKNTIARRLRSLDVSFHDELKTSRRDGFAQFAAETVAGIQKGLKPNQVPSRLYATKVLAQARGILVPPATKHLRMAINSGLLVEIDLGGRVRVELPGAPADMRPLYAVPENTESPQISDVFTITDRVPEKAWGLNTAVLITTPRAAARIIARYTA